MRIMRYTMTAAGVSPPIMLDYRQNLFNIALGLLPSNANTVLSAGVQFTLDDQSIWRDVTWSQAANTVTITDGTFRAGSSQFGNPHGLKTGDSVSIRGSSPGAAGFDGDYDVTVTNDLVYTITVAPSQTLSGVSQVVPRRWIFTTAIPAATAARTMVNSAQIATAVRANVATLTGGTLDFIVIQGSGTNS